MTPRAIHLTEALRLLQDGQPHELRLWKLSTGDTLLYPRAVCAGAWQRAGLHRVRLLPSGEIRALRDISLYEIDGLPVYF